MAQHPDIGEVAVVARAHPKWGERPMAFIVLNQQARATWKKDDLPKLDKAIKDFSRKSLAGYAVPEWIEFVDDLPKSRLVAGGRRCLAWS
jgi:acyl-coenzyme A synthetase/AMP-(fatty) acid ligase